MTDFVSKVKKFNSLIPNFKKFELAYKNFSSFIGNEEIKRSIERKIISWLFVKKEKNSSDFFKHLVIKGSPGCGKTMFARLYGELCCSLNLLESESEDDNDEDNDEDFDFSIYVHRNKLKTDIFNIKNQLKRIQKKFKKIVINFNDYWEHLRKNKFKTSLNYVFNKIKKVNDYEETQFKLLSKRKNKIVKTKEMPFITATRKDLIAEYIGQTAIKTEKVIKSALSGVLFIDEAYDLCHNASHIDGYDMECLTCLIENMDLNKKNLIVILVGYADKLDNTIFKVQPGLKRRIGLEISLDNYSADNLFNIFKKQVFELTGWTVEDDVIQLFSNQKFPFFGGDTQRLASYVQEFACERFINDHKCVKIITKNDVENGLKELKKLTTEKIFEHSHIYL